MELHFNTVTPLLRSTLELLMSERLFASFRLVGGTNLSLRYGHRLSDDIDLFTDAQYGSLDFDEFEEFLRRSFDYYYCCDRTQIVSFGRSYYVGNNKNDFIKIDLMYCDQYIRPTQTTNSVRMASIEDIAAMKIDVIGRTGRKKDFWDIHYLLQYFTLPQLIALHRERYPWQENEQELIQKMIDFTIADSMPDPRCLLCKDWDLIKLDIIEIVQQNDI